MSYAYYVICIGWCWLFGRNKMILKKNAEHNYKQFGFWNSNDAIILSFHYQGYKEEQLLKEKQHKILLSFMMHENRDNWVSC